MTWGTPNYAVRGARELFTAEVLSFLEKGSRRGHARMTEIREDREALFSKLQSAETQPEFWARVADDVDWTVEGTHPLAGRYHNKQEFIEATSAGWPACWSVG
jgi:hypothetical protein